MARVVGQEYHEASRRGKPLKSLGNVSKARKRWMAIVIHPHYYYAVTVFVYYVMGVAQDSPAATFLNVGKLLYVGKLFSLRGKVAIDTIVVISKNGIDTIGSPEA